jgi:hypothetical protein
LSQGLIGVGRRAAKLFTLEAANLRNVALDDEPAQRHGILPMKPIRLGDDAPAGPGRQAAVR